MLKANDMPTSTLTATQTYLSSHPRARAHNFRRCPFTSVELDRSFVDCHHHRSCQSSKNITVLEQTMAIPQQQHLIHHELRPISAFLKFLHLVNNDTYIPHGQQGHDKLFKVRPILDVLVSKIQSVYRPKESSPSMNR